ncbi:MAG TPA: HEPN domain-containing protein [Rhodothermales bacterium]|nr:HEPN domain-containing protein [Rhodothermales bacterium]
MAETERLEATRAWFAKGEGDLRSARILLDAEPPETDAAVFHCQQAAEKHIKGFLAFCGYDPPRIHDLGTLLSLAARFDAHLADLACSADALTPFAVHVRYPFAVGSPDATMAARAFHHAEIICTAIRQIVMGPSL